LLITSNGAVTWIRATAVTTLDADGLAVLDAAADRGSLTASDARIYWTRGGAPPSHLTR
jgi:hypothetical protein